MADFRISCCLCGKPVLKSGDIYALDDEWQRRFPALVGILACAKCALRNYWHCPYPADHPHPQDRDSGCCDSWDHILSHGTHAGVVIRYPWSGLLQGAGDYLRCAVRSRWVNPEVEELIRDTLNQWDTRR